jgi:hypothetical protein
MLKSKVHDDVKKKLIITVWEHSGPEPIRPALRARHWFRDVHSFLGTVSSSTRPRGRSSKRSRRAVVMWQWRQWRSVKAVGIDRRRSATRQGLRPETWTLRVLHERTEYHRLERLPRCRALFARSVTSVRRGFTSSDRTVVDHGSNRHRVDRRCRNKSYRVLIRSTCVLSYGLASEHMLQIV